MKSMKANKMISMEHKPMETGDNMSGIAKAISSSHDSNFPSVYISHPDLPNMKPGDKVKLHGVVKGFTARQTSGQDGEGSDNSADIDIHHMEMDPGMDTLAKPKKAKDDENDIEQGIAAAENNNS